MHFGDRDFSQGAPQQLVDSFIDITSAPEKVARDFLQMARNSLEEAIALYFQSFETQDDSLYESYPVQNTIDPSWNRPYSQEYEAVTTLSSFPQSMAIDSSEQISYTTTTTAATTTTIQEGTQTWIPQVSPQIVVSSPTPLKQKQPSFVIENNDSNDVMAEARVIADRDKKYFAIKLFRSKLETSASSSSTTTTNNYRDDGDNENDNEDDLNNPIWSSSFIQSLLENSFVYFKISVNSEKGKLFLKQIPENFQEIPLIIVNPISEKVELILKTNFTIDKFGEELVKFLIRQKQNSQESNNNNSIESSKQKFSQKQQNFNFLRAFKLITCLFKFPEGGQLIKEFSGRTTGSVLIYFATINSGKKLNLSYGGNIVESCDFLADFADGDNIEFLIHYNEHY